MLKPLENISGNIANSQTYGYKRAESEFADMVLALDPTAMDDVAAGADGARLFVLAIDDVEASMKTAQVVTRNFPHLRVIARARNRRHEHHLHSPFGPQLSVATYWCLRCRSPFEWLKWTPRPRPHTARAPRPLARAPRSMTERLRPPDPLPTQGRTP